MSSPHRAQWPPATLVALDFETSSPEAFGACAIGLARVEEGRLGDAFYSLLRPPSPRICYTHVHGLTWELLRDAPTFAEIWPQISATLAGASHFIAHNATFDARVLRACCRHAGLIPPPQPFLCTLRASRVHLAIPSRRLSHVCEHFGIALDHHNAVSDALACAHVFLRLIAQGAQEKSFGLI